MVRSEPVIRPLFKMSPLVVVVVVLLFLVSNLIPQLPPVSAHPPTLPGFVFTRVRGRCTPQYWSSRKGAWPRMAPPEATVAKVFGSRAHLRFGSDLTLLEAASRNDAVEDAYAVLLKQSTASLLNSYSRSGFPFRAWEVKTLLLRAMVSPEHAAHQAQLFLNANEACH